MFYVKGKKIIDQKEKSKKDDNETIMNIRIKKEMECKSCC